MDEKISSYWLVCDSEIQRKRILKRNNDSKDWELKRFLELNSIQNQSHSKEFIGKRIDTTHLKTEEVVQLILEDSTLKNH